MVGYARLPLLCCIGAAAGWDPNEAAAERYTRNLKAGLLWLNGRRTPCVPRPQTDPRTEAALRASVRFATRMPSDKKMLARLAMSESVRRERARKENLAPPPWETQPLEGMLNRSICTAMFAEPEHPVLTMFGVAWKKTMPYCLPRSEEETKAWVRAMENGDMCVRTRTLPAPLPPYLRARAQLATRTHRRAALAIAPPPRAAARTGARATGTRTHPSANQLTPCPTLSTACRRPPSSAPTLGFNSPVSTGSNLQVRASPRLAPSTTVALRMASRARHEGAREAEGWTAACKLAAR
jgi:hypothetical protein